MYSSFTPSLHDSTECERNPSISPPNHNKVQISQSILTYLKDVIADVIDMNDGWVPITELRAEHCPEPGWPCHQDNLVSIKDSPLHPKLHITQLWVVHKFWINPSPSREWSVSDILDWLPAKTCWENVCKEQCCSFILEYQKLQCHWAKYVLKPFTYLGLSGMKLNWWYWNSWAKHCATMTT